MLGLRWGAHRVCVQATFLGDSKNQNEDNVMVCFGKGSHMLLRKRAWT